MLAVLLLDGPEQAAGAVEVDVVGPAIERGEALLTASSAAAAVVGAVGAGGVPGHADEERAVVAEVGGPPVLRVGHDGGEIFFQLPVVERFEFFGVVELLAHGVGEAGVLVQEIEAEVVGPPVAIAHGGVALGDVAGCGAVGVRRGQTGTSLVRRLARWVRTLHRRCIRSVRWPWFSPWGVFLVVRLVHPERAGAGLELQLVGWRVLAVWQAAQIPMTSME